MENVKNVIETSIVKLSDELIINLLAKVTKSTVIAIEYITDEAKSRTFSGKKALQKRVKINNLYLNHDYAKKVQNLTDNKDFQANEMKGKERLTSTMILSTKSGDILLDGKILASESVKHLGYFHNNVEISKMDAIANEFFAPAYFNTNDKTTSGRGSVSLEDDFKMITLGISKIQYLKAFGIEYQR